MHDVLLGDEEIADVLLDTEDKVTLLPATIDLAGGAEALLLMRPGREYALKRALAEVGQDFDVIIVDCPPSLGVLTLNGAHRGRRGDRPAPVRDARASWCRAVAAHRPRGPADHQPNLTMLGAVATLFDARTTHSRDVLSDVADRYELPVLNPPIPRTVRFAEASASGSSVMRGRKNKGATAYRELAENLWKYWDAGGRVYAPSTSEAS